MNVSLPPKLAKEVRLAVKKGNYASVSEFFRELVKMWYSEELLFQDVKEAMEDVKAGRVYKLKSIRDIM